MKEIKVIKIPSTLFLYNKDHELYESAKSFALCVYTYLVERKGLDDKIYCDLAELLEVCGYKNNSNAYNRGYYKTLRLAIEYLQKMGYVGSVTSRSGESILEANAIKPKDRICLELSPKNLYFNCSFALIPYEEYKIMQGIKKQTPTMYWKCLMVYCYLCHELRYDPYTKIAKRSSWTFSHEKISEGLRNYISIQTIGKIFDLLRENELIFSSRAYVNIKEEDPAPYCIGTVICIVDGKHRGALQEELDTAKRDAQKRYTEAYKSGFLQQEQN